GGPGAGPMPQGPPPGMPGPGVPPGVGGPPMPMGPGGMGPSFCPPPGPPPDDSPFSLPRNSPNAFSDQTPRSPPSGLYLNIGTMGLQRQHLSHRGLAVLDSTGLDTGDPPPAGSPQILDSSDVSPNMTWGVRAGIGYRWENQAVEVTGFYLGESNSFALRAAPNALSLPVNALNSADTFPVGFEAVNGVQLLAILGVPSLHTRRGNQT